jgi:hypothetical protein
MRYPKGFQSPPLTMELMARGALSEISHEVMNE